MRWIEHMADMGEKREDEMDTAYGRYGGKEKGVQALVGNPEETTWKT